MKFNNVNALNKHLKDATPDHFAPVYLLLSKSEFYRKEAVRDLTKALLGQEAPSGYNLTVFDGERVSIAEVMQDLCSMTLFANRRVVLINQAEKLTKPFTAQLEKYFSNPSPAVYLVISASSINRATTFYKNSEKNGVVLDLPEEKSWEVENTLAQNVVGWVREKGKTIDPTTGRFLVKFTGSDPALLQQEIDKLICYVGDRNAISEADVRAISTGVNTEDAWQLGEAIFRKEGGKALRIALALLSAGEPFFSLVRQLRSQFRSKLQISTVLSTGGTPEDIQKHYPYMRGQILTKNIDQARTYGMDPLRKGILAIDDTELTAKNSALSHNLLFERLIIKLTT